MLNEAFPKLQFLEKAQMTITRKDINIYKMIPSTMKKRSLLRIPYKLPDTVLLYIYRTVLF
jgi:hypothetical protein